MNDQEGVRVAAQAANKQINALIRRAAGRVESQDMSTAENLQGESIEPVKPPRTNAGSGAGMIVPEGRIPNPNDWLRRSRVSREPVEFIQVLGIGGTK